MKRCPITYETCDDHYSLKGLKLLSKRLHSLKEFPYTAKQQLKLAEEYSDKISIQGVQPKLSVVLNVTKGVFEVAERHGRYILKPPHDLYDQIPENEDLTMRLANVVGIEIPLHGLIYNIDGTLSYIIKRFDRARSHKIATEDFSQLLGYTRDTKYESSIEKMITVIDKHCTFPLLEKIKFFRIIIFNYLVGNEDAHLKNFSLIRREDKVELSPAYDLLNTTIIINVKEECALPLNGKKSNFKQVDFLVYLGLDRLKLPVQIIEKEVEKFQEAIPKWKKLINNSFLKKELAEKYLALIDVRWHQLNGKHPLPIG